MPPEEASRHEMRCRGAVVDHSLNVAKGDKTVAPNTTADRKGEEQAATVRALWGVLLGHNGLSNYQNNKAGEQPSNGNVH